MLRCGVTFDENSVPLAQGGTSGGFRNGLSGRPCQTGHDNPLKASRPPSCSRPLSFCLLSPFGKGDFQGRQDLVQYLRSVAKKAPRPSIEE